jgi:sulfate transport system permease protein
MTSSSTRRRARWPLSRTTWGSPLPTEAAVAVPPPRLRARRAARQGLAGPAILGGFSVAWLTLIVLIPLAAVVARSLDDGVAAFWEDVTSPQAVAAMKLTLIASLIVAVIDAVMGTVIAWVLVRDEFPGKSAMNAVIDLPFALPTIVAGLVLLALYGPNGPVGINIAYTRVAILMALLFITLPFVVRAVQPVLMALERDVEEAAESLGAKPLTIFRRIILPALKPAMLAGVGLAFGRAVGEFGSVVLISGNLPYKTEVASVLVYGQIESDNATGAAAVSVVLLAISFLVLLGISFFARRGAHR